MKSCVIFSVSIFDKSKIHVLAEFLDMFKLKYFDCDFYIGINYNSISDVESIIESYNLNANIARLHNPDLYCGSDASAYQLALKYLKKSGKEYDLYWFAHTKGGVNERLYERSMYLQMLYNNRTDIEQFFSDYKYIGSFGIRGVSRSAGNLNWATYNKDHVIDICLNNITDDLACTHVNWSYIETMYVLNKKSIETFLALSTDEFFDTKIQEPCYFETVFPWIATRCGFFPYVYQTDCFFKERNLKDITHEWVLQNNLVHLNEYVNL